MNIAVEQKPGIWLSPAPLTFTTIILATALWFYLDPSLGQIWLAWMP